MNTQVFIRSLVCLIRLKCDDDDDDDDDDDNNNNNNYYYLYYIDYTRNIHTS